MNQENWEESESECNVCGEPIEIGSAASRCSNRNCLTRTRYGMGLSTDSSPEDIAHCLVSHALKNDRADLEGAENFDPERVAAKARMTRPNIDSVSLDDLVLAAREQLQNRPQTRIVGHEFGWNCGSCRDVNFHRIRDQSVDNGTVLACDDCGAEYEVNISRV